MDFLEEISRIPVMKTGQYAKERLQKEIKKSLDLVKKLPPSIYSPALNKEIKITRSFLNHLVNKKNRTKKQTYFRSKNIPQGMKLLSEINFYQKHSIKNRKNGDVEYWSLQGVIDKCIIEVVIRKIGNQNHHLFSLVYKGGVPRIINK